VIYVFVVIRSGILCASVIIYLISGIS